MRRALIPFLAAALLAGAAGSASAEEWRGGWRDHDIRRFHDHDFDHWRDGRWWHGRHDGRVGWWWTLGPNWYWYPEAVYPYPDPYLPPVAAAPVPVPAPGPVYYWCDHPRGYYPYVGACRTPWRAVPG